MKTRKLFILSGTSPLIVCDSTHPDCRPVALFKKKLRLLAIGGRPLQLALLGVFVKTILAAGHPHFCILCFRRLLHFYCLEHGTLPHLLPICLSDLVSIFLGVLAVARCRRSRDSQEGLSKRCCLGVVQRFDVSRRSCAQVTADWSGKLFHMQSSPLLPNAVNTLLRSRTKKELPFGSCADQGVVTHVTYPPPKRT